MEKRVLLIAGGGTRLLNPVEVARQVAAKHAPLVVWLLLGGHGGVVCYAVGSKPQRQSLLHKGLRGALGVLAEGCVSMVVCALHGGD